MFPRKVYLVVISSLIFLNFTTVKARNYSDEEWMNLRKKAAGRKRKVIYNNDAHDATCFPLKLAPTAENFYAIRLNGMLNSHIDTMSYVAHSTFTRTTYKTKIGYYDVCRDDKTRALSALLKNTDALQLVIDFCRKHNKEIFASFRMNDPHDMWSKWLFPPFKKQHPELLTGSKEDPPEYAFWTTVDYSHSQVRNILKGLVSEVAANYDVDGVELDFWRWPTFFKSVAWGKYASMREQEILTGMIRDIRQQLDKIGREKGKPILLAIRIPDSVGYCKNIGIDIETILKEKLVDIVIGGGNVLFNPVRKMTDFCHKYDTLYYESIDNPKLSEKLQPVRRTGDEYYYGRAAAALRGKADGVYYFNLFNPPRVRKLMLGDPKELKLKKKYNFATPVIVSMPNVSLKLGGKFLNRPYVSPFAPVLLSPQKTGFIVELGDDFQALANEGIKSSVTCVLKATSDEPENIKLTVNGKDVKQTAKGKEYLAYELPVEILKTGVNKFEVYTSPSSAKTVFRTIMRGNKRCTFPWRHLFKAHDFKNSEKCIAGAFRMIDSGTGKREIANLLYPLGTVNENITVKVSVKVIRSTTPDSVVLRIANGRYVEILSLQPGKVALLNAGKSLRLDTTDRFHNYEIKMQDNKVILIIDSRVKLIGDLSVRADSDKGMLKGFMHRTYNMHENSILFGSLSGPGTGCALWKNLQVSCDFTKSVLTDLVVISDFTRAAPPEIKKWDYSTAVPANMKYKTSLSSNQILAVELAGRIKNKNSRIVISNGVYVQTLRLSPDSIKTMSPAKYDLLTIAGGQESVYFFTLRDKELNIYFNGNKHGVFQCTYKPKQFLEKYGAKLTPEQRRIIEEGGAFVQENPDALRKFKVKKFIDPSVLAAVKFLDSKPECKYVLDADKNSSSEKVWVCTYAKDFKKTGVYKSLGKVIELDQNTAGKHKYQFIFLNNIFFRRLQGMVWCSFTIAAGDLPKNRKGLFNASLAAKDKYGNYYTGTCKIMDKALSVNNETMRIPAKEWDAGITVNCLLDPDNRIFIAKYGDKYLSIPAKKTDKPRIWFGDGAGLTAGKVYLKRISVGSVSK